MEAARSKFSDRLDVLAGFGVVIGWNILKRETNDAKTIKQSKSKAKVFQDFYYTVTHSVKQHDGRK